MQQHSEKWGIPHCRKKTNLSIVKNCGKKITNDVSNTQKIHGKIIKKIKYYYKTS